VRRWSAAMMRLASGLCNPSLDGIGHHWPMTDVADGVRIADNPAAHRYEVLRHGVVVGISQYALADDVITFLHTEVDLAAEGQGLGSRLAAGALDDVRRRGLRVIAKCPFIAAYLKRHPDYADLLAG
jgi:predicted GNAT family acetyltransferase